MPASLIGVKSTLTWHLQPDRNGHYATLAREGTRYNNFSKESHFYQLHALETKQNEMKWNLGAIVFLKVASLIIFTLYVPRKCHKNWPFESSILF